MNAAKDFEELRLKTQPEKLFEPIKSNKLKTFATILKTSKAKVESETVLLKASIDMFNHLLIIGKGREVDLKNLLSYSLTPVPLSLGNSTGTICKTNKSKLMHELGKGAEHVPEIPLGSALIIDGMTFIQQAQNIPVTFGQLADKLLHELVGMTKTYGSSRVDFVCDCYHSHSIKNCEREHRAVSGTQVVKISRPEQKMLKQFRKFLAEGLNKENLIEFLYESWAM